MKKCLQYGIHNRTEIIRRCVSLVFLMRLVRGATAGVWRIAAKNCGAAWILPTGAMTFLRASHYPMKKRLSAILSPAVSPFLAVFRHAPFVAHVEPLTQYRVTFICERPRRRSPAVVGPLQSGSQVSVRTNKFSINRRRWATIAPISL